MSERAIVTINGGSSSIKFAVFDCIGSDPQRRFDGQIERIGSSGTRLVVHEKHPRAPLRCAPGRSAAESGDSAEEAHAIDAADHAQAADRLIDFLHERLGATTIAAAGHRVVHGGFHLTEHQLVTDELISELKRTQPLDLAHLPREIALIESFHRRFPNLPQVACFDTAFHRDLPRVATLFPIPRRYDEAGVRRFGFHGLSYTYLMSELERIAGPDAARGRIILAHLGSGASMAAVKEGKPIDTTMAFTPLAGLVMGTRPGDLDPGLLVYMMRVEKKSPEQMDEMLSHDCGLAGLSGTGADMRDLLARRATDVRAAEAVALFVYTCRKFIGAYTAAMGGLDTLVFAGGIGEHAAPVRAQICDDFDFLGLRIDEAKNDAHAAVISGGDSRVTVRVMHTDEEIVIARAVARILSKDGSNG